MTNTTPATPRLPIPGLDDPRIRGLNHLLALIGADPALGKLDPLVVKPTDADFGQEPPADRVWIRLTPTFEPMEAYCQLGPGRVSYRAPASLKIELKAPGHLWENAALLWVRLGELWNPTHKQPGDRLAFQAALLAKGITEIEFTPPALADPSRVASGMVRIICYI